MRHVNPEETGNTDWFRAVIYLTCRAILWKEEKKEKKDDGDLEGQKNKETKEG